MSEQSPGQADVAERVARRIAEIGDRTLDATCPIYIDSGKPYPVLVGSAVLLRVHSASFALTAGHVADYAQSHQAYIGGADSLVRFGGRYVHTRPPPNGSRANDKVDLAVFELRPDLLEQLGECRFVLPSETAPDHVTDHRPVIGSYYVASGYPASKQPRRLIGREMAAHPAYLAAKAMPQSYVVEKKLDVKNSFFLEFDKETTWSGGSRRVAPDPHGLSGGGVWVVPGLLSGQPAPERLVGLSVEWHRRDRAILVTRIGLCFDAIRDHYPELDAYLPRPAW